jgi:hypothetical protein
LRWKRAKLFSLFSIVNVRFPFRLRRLQYVDLTLNYNEDVGRLIETLGFAALSPEMPEDAVDQELAYSSDRDAGAEEVNLLSQAAPQEHGATLPMPKKHVFGPVMAIIGIIAKPRRSHR